MGLEIVRLIRGGRRGRNDDEVVSILVDTLGLGQVFEEYIATARTAYLVVGE